MALLEVLPYPNPFLRHEASKVSAFDEDLKILTQNMCETMHDHDGVGLAATQIGVDAQVLILSSYVFMSEEERKIASTTGDMGKDWVVINPEVIEKSEQEQVDLEGCLSFPEVFIKVSRPIWVKIRAYDLEGQEFMLEGQGFGARAILHEMDHLNGKVMTDHLNFLSRKKALAKHQRIQKIRSTRAHEEEDSLGYSSTPLETKVKKTIHKAMKKKGKSGSRKKRK